MNILFARRALAALAAAMAAFSSLFAIVAQAQTPFTTGGAEVRQFLPRSTIDVYAAAYGGGLWRSTNAGVSWTRISLPGNARYLTGIAGNAGSYILVSGEEGLFRSTDGTNFTQILYEPVAAVAVAPSNSTRALVGIKGVGMLRSGDSGASFVQSNNAGIDSLDIRSVAFHPADADVAYVAAHPDNRCHNGQCPDQATANAARGGVFRTGDAGVSWITHNSNLTTLENMNGTGDWPNTYVHAVAVDTAGTVYAGVARPGGQGDVFMRTSAGATWTRSSDTFGGVVSLTRDKDGTTIWAGTRNFGLYSGSGTAFAYTFAHDGVANIFFTGINAVASLPGTSVWLKAIKGAGVWRTTTAANPRTWTRVVLKDGGNIGADRVLSASNVGLTGSMLAGLYAGGVWRTNDNGANWLAPTVTAALADFAFGAVQPSTITAFMSIWELAASPTNANLIYAAAGSVGMHYFNDNPGMFRWNGTNWGWVNPQASNTGAPVYGSPETGLPQMDQIFAVSLNRANEAIAYAGYLGSNAGIYRRSGTNWIEEIPPGVTPQTRAIVTSPSNSAKLLALEFDDEPAISLDSGDTWSQVTINQLGFERIRFFAAAENPTDANNWIGVTNKGIYVSTNGGSTWSRVDYASIANAALTPGVTPSVHLQMAGIAFRSNGRAFVADRAGNRFCSSNGGATWVSAGSQMRAGANAVRNVYSTVMYLTDGAGFQRQDTDC